MERLEIQVWVGFYNFRAISLFPELKFVFFSNFSFSGPFLQYYFAFVFPFLCCLRRR